MTTASTPGRELRLAVLLHADIVGSTVMVQRDEYIAHERMTGAFRRFAQTIATYHGAVHEIRGDALVAEFARASDAIAAAIAFQADNLQHNSTLPDDVVPHVRIGIAMGEVVVADGTVTGAGIVLAQRVEQLADDDGICVTAAIHEATPARMPIVFEDLGPRTLKGFDHAVNVHAVQLAPGAVLPAPGVGVTSRAVPARGWWLVTAIVVLSVVTGASWQYLQLPDVERAQPDKMVYALPDRPSIAVMPLTNLSAGDGQDYFADGMTEDIITDLSKVSGLFVIARNTTFTYKGRAVKVSTVAEDLGVRYVLEGSVRRAGDKIRVNAQLIDAVSGGHVWAERYDGSMRNVFAVQDEITGAIVAALSIALLPSEKQAQMHSDTSVPEAYDAFLVGWSHFQTRSLISTRAAKAALERAIELDPDYSRAWAVLADLHIQAGWFGYGQALRIDVAQVPAMLERALRRPTVHAFDAQLAWLFEVGDKDAMRVAVQHLEALDSNFPDTYAWKAIIAASDGDVQTARTQWQRALRLSPTTGRWYGELARIHLQVQDYTAARDALARAAALGADELAFLPDRIATEALSGNEDEAKSLALRLVALRTSQGHPTTIVKDFGRPILWHQDYKQTLWRGLARAGVPEVASAAELELDPQDQIVGAALAELVLGRTYVGRLPNGHWRVDTQRDGRALHFVNGRQRASSTATISDGVVTRVEDGGQTTHCRMYTNRHGRVGSQDSVLGICSHGVFKFDVLPFGGR